MAVTTNRVTAANDLDPKDRLMAINRVIEVTKDGRALIFAAIVVVGNEDGTVDYGMGHANEAPATIAKGAEVAKENLIRVSVHNGTVLREQVSRFEGARILLRPASAGSGVIAGGVMRTVLDGVNAIDILAKSLDSTNPHNLVKTTIAALVELRSPLMVAQSRGIPVECVFKGLPPRQVKNIMTEIKIEQVRSHIRRSKPQKYTPDDLGLRKMHQIMEHEGTPQIRGVVARVHHLVQAIE